MVNRPKVFQWFGRRDSCASKSDTTQSDALDSDARDKGRSPPTSSKSGLFDLHSPEGDVVVDIVAVHGINGDSMNTWTHKNGKLWLRDFLPAKVPDARIMTFGYNANIIGSLNNSGIMEHALALLERVLNKRVDENQGRPIIFICHSLGGLVVKKALLLSWQQSHFKSILDNAVACIFMGTPHGGSSLASFGSILANIASVFVHVSKKNMRSLKENSETLQELSVSFGHLQQSRQEQGKSLKIISFTEANKTMVGSKSIMVVSEQSARLNGGERWIPISSDHRDMCRFPSEDHSEYNLVWPRIQELVLLLRETKGNNTSSSSVSRSSAGTVRQPIHLHELDSGPFFKVPLRQNHLFVSRGNILEELHAMLTQGVQHERVVSLYGMGGAGKTQLAVQYAYAHRERYHVVIWADCKTIQGLYRSFSIIADSLHLSSQGPKQLETDFENVKSWLEQLRQDWLLILDNADNMDLQGPSLMHFIPASNHGHIILTSRDPLSRGIGLGGLEVGTMTKAEATCLLLKRARLEITEENRTEAEIIVESLGCLALAVDTAGAYVLARQITLQDLSRQYGRGKKRLLHYYIPNSMRQYDYNVAKTWEISLEYLENTCKDTSNCLHLIAFLDNENISEELFKFAGAPYVPPGLSEPFDEPPFTENYVPPWLKTLIASESHERHLVCGDASRFEEIATALQSTSLLQRKSGTQGYRIHPLVQYWARERLVDWENMQNSFLEQALVLIARALPTLRTQLAVAKQKFLGHVECVVGHVLKHCLVSDFSFSEALIWAVNGIANFLWLQGRLDEAEKLYEVAVVGLRTLFGAESAPCLRIRLNIGAVRREKGEWEKAEAIYLQVLHGMEKTMGIEDIQTFRALNFLAVLYKHQGRYQEAEVMCRRALSGREKVLGMDHPDTFWSLNTLAGLVARKKEFGEAQRLFRAALDGRERILGPNHRTTLMAVDSLANCYRSAGENLEAWNWYQRSLKGREIVLGLQHPDTLWTVNNMAEVQMLFANLEQAEELFERALKGRELALGEDSPYTLDSVDGMARLRLLQKDYDGSRALYERILQAYSSNGVKVNPRTVKAACGLAKLHEQTGAIEDARALLNRTLSEAECAWGADNLETTRIRSQLEVLNQGLE